VHFREDFLLGARLQVLGLKKQNQIEGMANLIAVQKSRTSSDNVFLLVSKSGKSQGPGTFLAVLVSLDSIDGAVITSGMFH